MSVGYSRVPRALLDDPGYWAASDAARSLLLTMHAHPSTHWTGIYRASAGILAEWHGRSRAQVQAALAELDKAGLAWCDGRVAMVPVLRWLPLENPNQVVSVIRYSAELPSSPLVGRWAGWVREGLRETWRQTFSTQLVALEARCGIVTVQAAPFVQVPPPLVAAPVAEPEPAQVLLPCVEPAVAPGAAAVAAWNKVTGQSLRPVDAHTKLANGRMDEGATIADLALVAEWAKRGPHSAWWLGKNDRSTVYLRPLTLWQASKFWAYLESARAWKLGGGSPDDEDDARARAAERRLTEKQITAQLASPAAADHAQPEPETAEEWGA